jgi:glycerol-3-phosphate acyltransferase PlsY
VIYPISWAHSWPFLAGALLAGYLLGSIPFGYILARLAGLGDIRKIGSGNIGATNVLRTGNRAVAGATLVLDAAKGAAAVLLAAEFGPDAAVLAAYGAVLGHLFPVWLGFRGGKGVATTLGVLLALSPPVGALACATWVLAALVARYSSLAALIAVAAAPVYAYVLSTPQHKEAAAIIAVVVWLRHLGNIRRLLAGTQPRIGAPRDA